MSDQPLKTASANQVDTVLQDYLDQLLVAATAVAEEPLTSAPPVTEKVQPQPAASEPAEKTAPPAVAVKDAPVVTYLQQNLHVSAPLQETVITDTPVAEVDVKESSVEELSPDIAALASLNWRSSQGIDCLIFKVAGLKLAIPLPLLGGVHNVTDKVTPLFGQAVWSLGVWQGENAKLTIIDSAQLIMPERHIRLSDEGYSFFIQLDRSPWALACQEICDTVTLVHDSIKWRGETSKRPWLAGTVISEMCALVDVPGLLKLLEENSRKRA
ncbi:MAG: chemotaxis protein CheW [Pseudomonadota bacterium]|nr:chemotaxis protein CheW [Pseudomonadota bacterium]